MTDNERQLADIYKSKNGLTVRVRTVKPTFLWRRGRDSNPCGVAPKRFSRPPRYDRFDTSPKKNGAANRSRTDDLILTKDVLYQLSHSSISFFYFRQVFEFLSLVPDDYIIISREVQFVNTFFKIF